MIGNLFAGTDESPGEMILYQGRSFKEYRGMGSIGAMRQGSRDRYFQDEFELESGKPSGDKLVPEGHRGPRAPQGQRRRHGAPARRRAARRHGLLRVRHDRGPSARRQLVRVTPAGLRESHVHDVTITKEAPNYRTE